MNWAIVEHRFLFSCKNHVKNVKCKLYFIPLWSPEQSYKRRVLRPSYSPIELPMLLVLNFRVKDLVKAAYATAQRLRAECEAARRSPFFSFGVHICHDTP